MSCCGRSRLTGGPFIASSPTVARPAARRFAVTFEYVGATALSVEGPVSGRHYRFTHTGHQLVVDARDRPALARVPKLREVA